MYYGRLPLTRSRAIAPTSSVRGRLTLRDGRPVDHAAVRPDVRNTVLIKALTCGYAATRAGSGVPAAPRAAALLWGLPGSIVTIGNRPPRAPPRAEPVTVRDQFRIGSWLPCVTHVRVTHRDHGARTRTELVGPTACAGTAEPVGDVARSRLDSHTVSSPRSLRVALGHPTGCAHRPTGCTSGARGGRAARPGAPGPTVHRDPGAGRTASTPHLRPPPPAPIGPAAPDARGRSRDEPQTDDVRHALGAHRGCGRRRHG